MARVEVGLALSLYHFRRTQGVKHTSGRPVSSSLLSVFVSPFISENHVCVSLPFDLSAFVQLPRYASLLAWALCCMPAVFCIGLNRIRLKKTQLTTQQLEMKELGAQKGNDS